MTKKEIYEDAYNEFVAAETFSGNIFDVYFKLINKYDFNEKAFKVIFKVLTNRIDNNKSIESTNLRNHYISLRNIHEYITDRMFNYK